MAADIYPGNAQIGQALAAGLKAALLAWLKALGMVANNEIQGVWARLQDVAIPLATLAQAKLDALGGVYPGGTAFSDALKHVYSDWGDASGAWEIVLGVLGRIGVAARTSADSQASARSSLLTALTTSPGYPGHAAMRIALSTAVVGLFGAEGAPIRSCLYARQGYGDPILDSPVNWQPAVHAAVDPLIVDPPH